jgi:hypothetical protein
MQWVARRHWQPYLLNYDTSTSRHGPKRTGDKGNREDDGSAKPTFVSDAVRAVPMVEKRRASEGVAVFQKHQPVVARQQTKEQRRSPHSPTDLF